MKKAVLINLYKNKQLSVSDIAARFKYSENKINYWIRKYKIRKRTISEAIYIKYHPNGDPFVFKKPQNIKDSILFGMGLGLYWGEGNKANKNTVRLGNSDPRLVETFIKFLDMFFGIKKENLKFQLQVFSDLNTNAVIKYWVNFLRIKKSQLFKTIVTPTRSLGTYKKKSKYGVMTVYYGNTKVRNILVNLLLKK